MNAVRLSYRFGGEWLSLVDYLCRGMSAQLFSAAFVERGLEMQRRRWIE